MTINFNNTWRPLPDSLTIDKSPVEGLGCFATQDIPANTELGLLRVQCNEDLIRTALGSFINHSSEYNCINYPVDDTRGLWPRPPQWHLITSRDIKEGEELFLCYQMPEYYN